VPLSLSLILTIALGAVDRAMLAAFMDGATVGVYHAGYSLSSRTLDVIFLWLGMAGAPALIAAYESRAGRRGLRGPRASCARLIVLIAFPAAVGSPSSPSHLRGHAGRGVPRGRRPRHALDRGRRALRGFTTHYLNHAFIIGRAPAAAGDAMTWPRLQHRLNLLLIPATAWTGAVWATAASFALGAAASWALGRGATGLPLPARDFALCGAASAVMAAVVLSLPALGGMPRAAAQGRRGRAGLRRGRLRARRGRRARAGWPAACGPPARLA
jgi:hypothetical protein